MKIYTRVEVDMLTGRVTNAESYEYSGPVAECKGDGTAKAQLALQNKLVQQQLDMSNQRLNMVKDSVGKYLTSSEGYDPAQLATMRAQFLNQNAMNYNQGAKNVMTALARRGSISSTAPVGGDFTRGIASLEGAAASDRSSGLANIDLSNLNQALTNRFNAASLMNGGAATLSNNVGSFNYGASNALGQYVSAANQGFGASLMKGLGGTLGAGLGGSLAGGLVGGIGGVMPGGSGFGSGFRNGS